MTRTYKAQLRNKLQYTLLNIQSYQYTKINDDIVTRQWISRFMWMS